MLLDLTHPGLLRNPLNYQHINTPSEQQSPMSSMDLLLLLFLLISGLFVICDGDIDTFDCPMRQLALQYAQYIQPHLSLPQLQEIADALNGSPEAQNCTISPNKLFAHILHKIAKYKTPPTWIDIDNNNTDIELKIYVSDTNGSDKYNTGLSIHSPLKTMHYALDKLHEYRNNSISIPAMIVLRAGTYYLQSTLNFNYLDSNLITTNLSNGTVLFINIGYLYLYILYCNLIEHHYLLAIFVGFPQVNLIIVWMISLAQMAYRGELL